MIKLNNKNITYVALADSSNSIKAPKEIWYADSANSVKLVYRRKDALIEGEDYEKYHWLVANTPYGTNIELPLNTANFSFKRIWRDAFNDTLFLSNSEQYVYHAVLKNVHIWDIPNATDIFVGNANRIRNEEIIIYSTDENLTIGDEEVPQLDYPPSIIRFRNADRTNSTQFSTSSIYADGVEHYIPCKLLKPVPKWLDANGIRRQVGECGMIDLVSGKFYGNVNSVGTFTVENYYERKEWLQGRNGAYIDTNYYPIVGTDVFSVHFRYDGTLKNPDGTEQDAFGASITNGRLSAYINGNNFLSCNYCRNTNSWFPSSGKYSLDWDISNLRIDGENFKYDANNDSYSFSNKEIQIATGSKTLYVFSCNQSASTYLHGDISSFKITDTSSNTKMNLIPCTLTMDLPASMDANNIARTKGTSGMWDLVSDKFYGNVANSGTFKAVNLAEGVDYEVHDWLVVEINSVGTLQRLPINSSSMSYRVKRINGNNLHLFRTDGYDYYYRTENFHLGIYDLNQKTLIYNNSSITDNELDFECSAGNVSANGVDIPIYGFPIKEVRFHAADRGGMKTYTSSITVDGIERYIPVKLLKAIPAKYDANGIARQAGECGMYDTVNDVFYGNVASSGTFSVSDDS